MPIVAAIKFDNSSRTYYFSPNGLQLEVGDNVIVETSQGIEWGEVVKPSLEVLDSAIVSPLKPVIRVATEKDREQRSKLAELNQKALEVAEEKVKARKLVLKLLRAEYGFDMKKVTIFFTANGRVDFRELVKDLASALKTRIELRQVYERDEFKIMGAMGVCGRPCCCSSYLQDFCKVSIKMAKLQGLSLNPTKINGVCGKLMCCLAYENDYYKEVFSEMPKVKSKVMTPEGEGIVEENYPLTKKVKCKFVTEDAIHYAVYDLSELNVLKKQKLQDIPEDNGDTLPDTDVPPDDGSDE